METVDCPGKELLDEGMMLWCETIYVDREGEEYESSCLQLE